MATERLACREDILAIGTCESFVRVNFPPLAFLRRLLLLAVALFHVMNYFFNRQFCNLLILLIIFLFIYIRLEICLLNLSWKLIDKILDRLLLRWAPLVGSAYLDGDFHLNRFSAWECQGYLMRALVGCNNRCLLLHCLLGWQKRFLINLTLHRSLSFHHLFQPLKFCVNLLVLNLIGNIGSILQFGDT